MNCAMCPTWVGGGMILHAVIGVLLVIPLSKQFPRRVRISSRSSNGTAILEKSVSDRDTLEDVSQSPQSPFKRCRKLLILNGEMLERSIRHAWKAKRASNTERLRSALRHTRSAA